MRSLSHTTRGAVDGAKDTISEYKGWLILGLFAYVLWKFNGLFSTLGGTAQAGIEAATSGIKAKAEAASAAAKVKSDTEAGKAKVALIAPGATTEQVAQYRRDAASLAAAWGTGKKLTANYVFEQNDIAFGILKKYSRLLLSNNKPWVLATKTSQNEETAGSAKRKVNYMVLAPFYEEETEGRNLYADAKKYLTPSKYPIIKWVL